MAIQTVLNKQRGGQSQEEKREGPVWELIRNAYQDVREIAPGMIAGPLMLGRDLAMDVGSIATGDTDFDRTAKTVGGMAEGFVAETPLVPFFKGDFDEAKSRWHKRPVSGTLDIAGLAGIGSAAKAKLAHGAAHTAPKAKRLGLMQEAGYERVGKYKQAEDLLRTPEPTLKYRFDERAVRVGDEVYARPTHRRILPSYDDPILRKDPKDPYSHVDIHDLDNVDVGIADRLKNIDAWSRTSRTPLWRYMGEGAAEFRRTSRPYDKALSSSWSADRKRGKAASKAGYVAFGTSKGLHDTNNKTLINELAKELKREGLRDVDIEEIADYGSYLSAAGYARIEKRLADLHGTHNGAVQAARSARYQRRAAELNAEADRLEAQVNALGDPHTKQARALRDELYLKRREVVDARVKYKASARYMKHRDSGKTFGGDDPRSGYTNEVNMIAKYGEDRLNRIMNSDAMERWLDNLEFAADDAEKYAMRNLNRALSKGQVLENRFRMADLYRPEGVTQETMAQYMRGRKDGKGVRTPVFIPMRSMKRDQLPFLAGKRQNPMARKDDMAMNDALDLELWGQNNRKPITMKLFQRKHAAEIQDFHYNRITGNIRKMAVGMSKKDIATWENATKHGPDSGQPTVSRVGKDGVPLDPRADFVALGEFQSVLDTNLMALTDLEMQLRRHGLEQEANQLKQMKDNLSLNRDHREGKLRTGEGMSAKEFQRSQEFPEGMDIVLPTSAYTSVIRNMIETSEAVLNLSNYPSMSKTIGKGWDRTMQIWKYNVLHARPKWMVNNALGSIYMLAMQEGWAPAFAAMIRGSSLFKWAQEFLGIKPKQLERGGKRHISEVVEQKMSDVLYAAGSNTMFGFTDRHITTIQFLDKAADKIADFNAKVADNPARSGRIHQLINQRLKEYKRAMAQDGRKVTKSDFDLVSEMLDDIETRESIARVALEDMIDFQDLSEFERKVVVRFMAPFYSWLKGSTRATIRNLGDKPIRSGWQREAGKEVHRQLEEQFPGGIPSYLWGSLPGGWTGGSKRGVINFAGASPAQTLGDLGAIGGWAAGGIPMQFGSESPLGWSNPVVTAGVGSLTMRHPFFGTPIKRTKLGPQVWWDVLQPPWYRSAYRMGIAPEYGLTGKRYEPSDQTIAEHSPFSYFERLVAPHRQTIVPGVARERYKEELTDLGY